MASSPLPLLLGAAAALLLLKGKGGSGSAGSTATEEDEDVGGGAAGGSSGGSSGGSTGSSGYKDVSISKMKVIQQQLSQLGFNPGKIDGKWNSGGNTFKAVKAFQSANGLAADGKPGPNTRAKLNQLSGSSSGEDTSSSSDSGSGGGQTYTQAELEKVPALKSGDEVVFNATLSDYDVGATWRYATLDNWLNGLRISDQLATKSDGASEDVTGQSVNYWLDRAMAGVTSVGFVAGGIVAAEYGAAAVAALAVATPVAVAAAAAGVIMGSVFLAAWQGLFLDNIRKKQIEVTGARALDKFVRTQKVLVGPGRIPVRIKDLKRTPDVVDFLKEVSDYIARFQSSTYN